MNTRQIDLDLDRTFPTNYLFESLDGDAALALRRVRSMLDLQCTWDAPTS